MSTTTYRVFLGEFSKKWVGVKYKNGERVASVQRDSKQEAEQAIRQLKPVRFECLT